MTARKTPGWVHDYLSVKAQRLELQRHCAQLEKQEKELKEQIISALREDPRKLGSEMSRVTLKTKDKPHATDWSQIFSYIAEHDAFDLVQKRLTETAVQARWDEGEAIPGIEHTPVYDIEITG